MNNLDNNPVCLSDNPLNFSTDPGQFWEHETTNNNEDIPKMKYDEVIPTCAMWRDQGYRFIIQWLEEIKKESKKPIGKQHRGMPYKRVLKQWQVFYGENDLAEIVRVARKIMDFIIKEHPQMKNHL